MRWLYDHHEDGLSSSEDTRAWTNKKIRVSLFDDPSLRRRAFLGVYPCPLPIAHIERQLLLNNL